MSFANPFGLLGLLALPAIIVIHLYHQRFPRLMVAGLHLWSAESEMRTAGRRRERLPVTTSLVLELLAALLLSLLLADPRFGELDRVIHLVVVLDNSASMSARPNGPQTPSFRDAAVAELKSRVEDLHRGSVVTLILTGQRPTMLSGPAVEWKRAETAIQDWHPSLPAHSFESAWDLGAQLAGEDGQFLFLTDNIVPADVPVPQQMEIVSVGRQADNVALTAAEWTFDPSDNIGRVYLRVRNFGREAADVTVVGKTESQTAFRQTLSIAADDEIPLETELPGGLGQLEVRVESVRDTLEVDSSVVLIEPKVRTLTVSNSLEPQTARFRLVDRVLRSSPDLQNGDVNSAHLAIGPADQLPPSRDDLWWLGVGPVDGSEEARQQSKNLIGPYVMEKRHPLLDGIALGGVVWGGVQPLDLAITPLISAGDFPLLSRLSGTRTTAYLMNIDLDRSNLPETPDWPILLTNLVEQRRDNLPGLRRWNYRLNEDIRFRLFEESNVAQTETPQRLTLVHHGQERELVRSAIVEVPPLDEPGVYDIRDGDTSVGRFAVNFFDTDESSLAHLQSGVRQPTLAESVTSNGIVIDRPFSWIVMLLVLLVMIVALFDWYVLKPRRGVG